MGNLITRYVLSLLPKISLSAEERDKLAEVLTQYIEAPRLVVPGADVNFPTDCPREVS